jgi:tetratricopeptide (TPR) repeat protein
MVDENWEMYKVGQEVINYALHQAKLGHGKINNIYVLRIYNSILQQRSKNRIAKQEVKKLQKKLSRTGSKKLKINDIPEDKVNQLLHLYKTKQTVKLELVSEELLQTYPQSLSVMNMLGAALLHQGKMQKVVGLYNTVIQIHPDCEEAYINRGGALRGIGKTEDAMKDLEKAIMLRPDMASAYYNYGNILGDIGRTKDQLLNYEMSIILNPDYAEAYNCCGNVQQQLGEFDRALECYGMAIVSKSNYTEAYHNLSKIKKFSPDDIQIRLMEKLYLDSRCSDQDRINISFALAKVYDDLGEYERSIEYLNVANQLCKRKQDYDIQDEFRIIKVVKKLFSAGAVTIKPCRNGDRLIRPIFIVGMVRSGTSLVEQILASHSKVYGMGELKTIVELIKPILLNSLKNGDEFNESNLSIDDVAIIRNRYIDVVNSMNISERFIIDKMPANFRWIGFILSAFPEAKVINLNRDPMATCWSIYKHYFATKGNGFTHDMEDIAEYYKMYTDVMLFWHELFPTSIYDLCYEDLTENQVDQTRSLLDFCGLEWEEQCLDFYNTKRSVKTLSAVQVRSKMYKGSSESWRKYQSYLQPLMNGLDYGNQQR